MMKNKSDFNHRRDDRPAAPATTAAHGLLDAIARDHLPEEINLLPRVMARVEQRRKSTMNPKLKLAVTILVVFVLGVALLSIPTVVEALQRMLGYIPGSGLVDNSQPIRVLEAPVSQTRDGVTVTVNKAVLTVERTQIEFSVFGVPAEAYPNAEDIQGCFQRPYLLLNDGTQLTEADPIPASVDHATFIIPCIANTLPGKAPQDWRFELRFVPAPPDLTVMPVVDVVTPLAGAETVTPTVGASGRTPLPTGAPAEVRVAVEKLVETSDGYILIGAFRPQVAEGTWVEVTDMPRITDAAGQFVRYDLVTDIELPVVEDGSMGRGEFSWAYKIKDAGVTYPLTLSFEGVYISAAVNSSPSTGSGDESAVEFEFDAGAAPQFGQEWRLEKDIQISGHTLRLIAITCSGDGYNFVFSNQGDSHSVNVEIVGHVPAGGGGGYGSESFNNDMIFDQLPTGKLTVRLSNLMVRSAPYIWETQWQPETDHPGRGDRPVAPTQAAGTCVDTNTIAALPGVPAEMAGMLMIYDPVNTIVETRDLASLQAAFTLPNAANRAVFSPDGSQIAYSDETAMQIVDAATGQTTRVINYALGYNTAWSPVPQGEDDQSKLAYVAGGAGIYVVGVEDGKPPYRVSEIANESIAGWSADGAFLYVTQPDLSSGSWMLRKIDVNSGAAENVFTLENASRKAPFAALSPDGRWLAYRNMDLNAILMVETQNVASLPTGGEARQLVDLSGSPDYIAIGNLVWSGGWLGANLLGDEGEFAALLVNPATCEAYRIDGVGGYL
ncbi:MAG TPA: hypothetical protein VFF78_00380, partial [Anaerolineaceae bacterium]|nr:hypothetical protein [Anaerolineaceae bacterium]